MNSSVSQRAVLYIDDEPDYFETVRDALGTAYKVTLVQNEDDFDRHLVNAIPDVFLIDWLLRDAHGQIKTAEDLLNKLRQSYPKHAIIVLTAGLDARATRVIQEYDCAYVDKRFPEKLSDFLERNTAANELLAAQYADLQANARQREVFFRRCVEVSSGIVDERLSGDDFVVSVLRLVLSANNYCQIAFVWLPSGEGLFVSATPDSRSNAVGTLDKVVLSELVDLDIFRSTLGEIAEKAALVGEACRALIVNNFRQNAAYSPATLPALRKSSNLLLVPIYEDDVAFLPHSNRRRLMGCMFLYDKQGGGEFSNDDAAQMVDLPLSAMLRSARDMPFRLFEAEGLWRWLTRHLFGPSMLGRFGFKRWKAERFVMATMMESLRLSMLVIAVLMFVWPLTTYILPDQTPHVEGGATPGHSHSEPVVEILRRVDILIMFLTISLVSLGLLMLYQPKYISQYGHTLPKWMHKFTYVGTLKKTILTLVVIIVAIGILEEFISDAQAKDQALPFLYHAIGAFLTIIGIAVFIKLCLHEDGEPAAKEESVTDICIK